MYEEDKTSEEKTDMQMLMRKVLIQAMSDYVKLMHPRQRTRIYLQEAWWFAVDLLFDDSFVFKNLVDEEGNNMTLFDLVKAAADRENLNIEKLRSHVIAEAIREWNAKELFIMVEEVKDIIIQGQVYAVLRGTPTHNRVYAVDYDEREVLISSKLDRQGFERAVILATTEAICYHKDFRISAKTRDELAASFYEVLRINDSFNSP